MNLNEAAAAMGRAGGSKKSAAKTAAARLNAAKGGRPLLADPSPATLYHRAWRKRRQEGKC